MAQVKISELTPIVTASMTDILPVVPEANIDIETNRANFGDVFTLFQPGATGTITSTTTLEGPVPHTIILAPSGADQVITFMPFTAANHARFGDPIRIINLGNFAVQLRYSDDNPIPGSVINAGNVRDYIIRTVGNPGVLQVTGIFGTICNQDSPLDINDGGTGATTAADARINLGLEYESGTHNTNWTGAWASPLAGNIAYARLNNTVFLTLPDVQDQATANGPITNVTALPVSLRPTTTAFVPLLILDESVDKWGLAIINSSGVISIYAGPNMDLFLSEGGAGFYKSELIYNLN